MVQNINSGSGTRKSLFQCVIHTRNLQFYTAVTFLSFRQSSDTVCVLLISTCLCSHRMARTLDVRILSEE